MIPARVQFSSTAWMVRDYRLQSLRDQIGYVLQETVLFRGTVRDNIAYGRAGATDEEIIEGGQAGECR